MGKKWRTRKIKNKNRNKSKTGKRVKTMRRKYVQKGGVKIFGYKPTIQEIIDYAVDNTITLTVNFKYKGSFGNKLFSTQPILFADGPHFKIKETAQNKNLKNGDENYFETIFSFKEQSGQLIVEDKGDNLIYKGKIIEIVEDEAFKKIREILISLRKDDDTKKQEESELEQTKSSKLQELQKNDYKVFVVNLKNIFSKMDEFNNSFNSGNLFNFSIKRAFSNADETNFNYFLRCIKSRYERFIKSAELTDDNKEDYEKLKSLLTTKEPLDIDGVKFSNPILLFVSKKEDAKLDPYFENYLGCTIYEIKNSVPIQTRIFESPKNDGNVFNGESIDGDIPKKEKLELLITKEIKSQPKKFKKQSSVEEKGDNEVPSETIKKTDLSSETQSNVVAIPTLKNQQPNFSNNHILSNDKELAMLENIITFINKLDKSE